MKGVVPRGDYASAAPKMSSLNKWIVRRSVLVVPHLAPGLLPQSSPALQQKRPSRRAGNDAESISSPGSSRSANRPATFAKIVKVNEQGATEMPVDSRKDWSGLPHRQKVEVLAATPIDQILADYRYGDQPESTFRDQLAREVRLWQPQNLRELKTAGKPPSKEVVLGAWRDLDRAEALLELIDNSIDEWQRRRRTHPTKSAPELNIHVSVDTGLGQLTYEDNAGGVSVEKLHHLVVPGYSDTTDLSQTIGSYKTGGKKAVFRLATAAQITTRYWNPAETSDDAVTVQLDHDWMSDPEKYEFEFSLLKNKSILERGQTRYVLQLREEPVGGPPWFTNPEQVAKIAHQIRQTYTLLLIRNPKIHVYFFDNSKPLEPIGKLYDFSGTHKKDVDIRPQQIIFELELEHGLSKESVQIEIVLGCRTSTGAKEGRSWGIDLYGNDRLFVVNDQTTFATMLPHGASRNLIRGFVNIHGPNVFIPWDTHKRHLNTDSRIMAVLTKNSLIQEMFANWKAAYNAISSSDEIAKLIETPVPKPIDDSKHDLAIAHRFKVKVDFKKRRGVQLESPVFKPKVPAKKKRSDSVKVKFSLTPTEARQLLAYFGIDGDPQDSGSANELSSSIKEEILKRVKR